VKLLRNEPTKGRRATPAPEKPATPYVRTSLKKRLDSGHGHNADPDQAAAYHGEHTPAQFEFLMAVQEWKRLNRRSSPSLSETLAIVKLLGYRKVLPRQIELSCPAAPVEKVVSC